MIWCQSTPGIHAGSGFMASQSLLSAKGGSAPACTCASSPTYPGAGTLSQLWKVDTRCIKPCMKLARIDTAQQIKQEGDRAMKALVIGGGIGGFATALSLHAVGIECQVFEQSHPIRELGVGINILPYAIKELAELGLLDALDRVAVRTS